MKIDIDDNIAINPEHVFSVKVALDPARLPGYALNTQTNNWLEVQTFAKVKFASELMTTAQAIRIKREIESDVAFHGATV